MLIGYARTSTIEQEAGLEGQFRELEGDGVEKIFSEQVSSVAVRDELERALEFVREGDTLVVTRLDRLARSMRDLLDIVDRIAAKKAELRIRAMNLDTGTATGKLMLQVLGAVAEFERSLMLERQREGIRKAREAGKYKGRKPTARALRPKIVELLAGGVGATDISEQLGISRSSVYRIKDGG